MRARRSSSRRVRRGRPAAVLALPARGAHLPRRLYGDDLSFLQGGLPAAVRLGLVVHGVLPVVPPADRHRGQARRGGARPHGRGRRWAWSTRWDACRADRRPSRTGSRRSATCSVARRCTRSASCRFVPLAWRLAPRGGSRRCSAPLRRRSSGPAVAPSGAGAVDLPAAERDRPRAPPVADARHRAAARGPRRPGRRRLEPRVCARAVARAVGDRAPRRSGWPSRTPCPRASGAQNRSEGGGSGPRKRGLPKGDGKKAKKKRR